MSQRASSAFVEQYLSGVSVEMVKNQRNSRVVQTHAILFYFWTQCRKEADQTYNDSEWSHLQSILSQSRNSSFNSRVVVCRIRLFSTLISKIKWLGFELPLKAPIFIMLYSDHLRWNLPEYITLMCIRPKK